MSQRGLPPTRLPSIHEMMLLHDNEGSPSPAPHWSIPAQDSEQSAPGPHANPGLLLLPALDPTARTLMTANHADQTLAASANLVNPTSPVFGGTGLNLMAQLQAAVAAAAEEEERMQTGFGHSGLPLHGDGAPGASPAQIQIQPTLDTGLMHVDPRAPAPPRALTRDERIRIYRQRPAEVEDVDGDELEQLEELARRRHEENKERYRAQYEEAMQRWREEERQRADNSNDDNIQDESDTTGNDQEASAAPNP
ncbi:hypothetical protein BC830DRAFT_1167552 [Chytriomyces sp. MP71]|nr:hypothetical protein BC830DRAFT_1167552 [Chytriomyces sp. MP71]